MAFSGGPDSVALTLLLRDLGYALRLAYVNHGLRGEESEQEEAWVRAFAEAHQVPLEVQRLSPSQLRGPQGLQAAARRQRYEWMSALLERNQIGWGVTAHTWNDWVETLWYYFLRGGGVWLLRGMPLRRGPWLRPLLQEDRRTLLAYLQSRKASYLLDRSNYEPKYLRNRVRWRLLPAARALHPHVEERLKAWYELYRLQKQRLEGLYRRIEARYIEPTPFGGLIRKGLRQDAFYWLLHRYWGIGWHEAKSLYALYRKGRTGAVRKWRDTTFCKIPMGLEWGRTDLWEANWAPLTLTALGAHRWGLWTFLLCEEAPAEAAVALPKALFPLQVRHWQEGDRIAPVGLHGHTRRLSDVWPEAGLYGFRRRHAFVLTGTDQTLYYAAAYRLHWQIPHMSGPFLYFSYIYGDGHSSYS